MAPKYSSTLIITTTIFGLISCSDVTNISKEQVQESVHLFDGSNTRIINEENQPLFVLNDKIFPNDLTKSFKPEYVDSIVVLKGKTALQEYGKKGEYGVIKIYADAKILEDLKADSLN